MSGWPQVLCLCPGWSGCARGPSRSGQGTVAGFLRSVSETCRCSRRLQLFAEVLPNPRLPVQPCAACFASYAHPTAQMSLRRSFKSFRDTCVFMQPNSKAILFLLNFEIPLIPPVLYPCFMFKKERKNNSRLCALKKDIVGPKIILCNKGLMCYLSTR